MSRKAPQWISLAGAALAIALGSGSANAMTYSFADPGMASGSLDSDTGIVTLTSLLSNPRTAADEISGVIFNFASSPGTLTTGLLGSGDQLGQLIDFTVTNGQKRSVSTQPASGDPTRWKVQQSGDSVTLTALSSGKPENLIVGPGPYTDANDSIPNFNSHIWQTGTFILSGLVNSLPSFTVQFEYGTSAESSSGVLTPPIHTVVAPTPLPGTFPLFASGLLVLGLLQWRRKNKVAVAAVA